MTDDEVIADVLRREGGYVDDPADRGGATHFGITAATLGEWRRLGRPATRDEVQALTDDEATAIYRARYVRPFETVPFPEVRAHLVDFAVHSGVTTAIKTLQRVLGVPDDGILGERTRTALVVYPWRLTQAALVAERVKLLSRLVDKDAKQSRFLRGWVKRAVGFLV